MLRSFRNPAPPLPEGQVALFFDIDGTLAPLAPTPQEAAIPGETLAILRMLHQYTGGAVAFVSGRNLNDIDRLSGQPFTAAGQHGLELRLASGVIERLDVHREIIHSVAQELLAWQETQPGLLVEAKGLSVAVHFRQAPGLATTVKDKIVAIAARYEGILCIQHGKMVEELRIATGSKSEAIRRFLTAPPFAGKMPIFAGDDITDEDGFAAINELGGISIKVGRGETNAQWRIDSVENLGSWLRRLALHLVPPHKEYAK